MRILIAIFVGAILCYSGFVNAETVQVISCDQGNACIIQNLSVDSEEVLVIKFIGQVIAEPVFLRLDAFPVGQGALWDCDIADLGYQSIVLPAEANTSVDVTYLSESLECQDIDVVIYDDTRTIISGSTLEYELIRVALLTN